MGHALRALGWRGAALSEPSHRSSRLSPRGGEREPERWRIIKKGDASQDGRRDAATIRNGRTAGGFRNSPAEFGASDHQRQNYGLPRREMVARALAPERAAQ